MQAHPDFAGMDDGDVGERYKILCNICNGSMKTTKEETLSNELDAVNNWLFIKGDNYPTLSEHMEGFENCYDVVEKAGFTIASVDLCEFYMIELKNEGEKTGATYK